MTKHPLWQLSASGIAPGTCYIGHAAPIVDVRSGPRCAETSGNSTSVGRPAEYNTFGEYAGRVPLGSRASNRPDYRAGLRNCGGRRLRIICTGLMALALTACAPTAGTGNEAEAASDAPPILDLLASGDITACAHPAVMSVFEENSRVSFEDARQKLSLTRDQYDAVAPDDFSFKEISTTKANKEIAEVQCEANLYAVDHNLGVVKYSVRPSSAGDGIIVSYDENIGKMLFLAKLDHENALKRTVPTASQPIEQSAPAEDSDTTTTTTTVPQASEGEPATSYDRAKAALDEAGGN